MSPTRKTRLGVGALAFTALSAVAIVGVVNEPGDEPSPAVCAVADEDRPQAGQALDPLDINGRRSHLEAQLTYFEKLREAAGDDANREAADAAATATKGILAVLSGFDGDDPVVFLAGNLIALDEAGERLDRATSDLESELDRACPTSADR